MRIADVIRRKGDTVATIEPERTVSELMARLSEHKIGALVVSSDGTSVDGIVSERDVVRQLHRRGPSVLSAPLSEIMTPKVRTCTPEASVEDLMRVMTEHRFRHVPVVVEGQLVGIVSIGDVVKHRIDELQSERDQLTAYITS